MDYLKIPDRDERVRWRVGIDCKSAAIAAKIITGQHLGSNAWRPVDREGAD